MAESKQDESFKVIDRRLFNADGEIREEIVREERQKEQAQVLPKSASAAKPAPVGAPAEGQSVVASPADANAPKPSRGFQMLTNFVAQNAAMLLGAYPDPRTGEAMLDLEGARELIDMLDALRDATRGNLAPEDDRLLLDVLGSLKLSYMEMTKAAAKAARDRSAKAQP